MQYPELRAQLEKYSKEAEINYHGGQPRHLYDPGSSCFKIISKNDFDGKTELELAGLLRTQHIVIPDYKTWNVMFDSQGLRMIQPLKNSILMRGIYMLYAT